MSGNVAERVLLDLIGYGRLGEMMKEKDPLKTNMKTFFKETVFGTYKSFDTSAHDTQGDIRRDLYPKKVVDIGKMDFIQPSSSFHHCFDPNDQKPERLIDGWQVPAAINNDGYPFFVGGSSFFWQYHPEQVLEFIQEKGNAFFPNARISFGKLNIPKWTVESHTGNDKKKTYRLKLFKTPKHVTHFMVEVRDEGLYFSVYGTLNSMNSRHMSVGFEAEQDFVDGINETTARYYSALSKRQNRNLARSHGIETHRVKKTESAHPVYDSVASSIMQMTKTDALETLGDIDPVDYSSGDSYRSGNVISHSKFGLGVVIADGPSRIDVYFPSLTGTKAQCTKKLVNNWV